MINLLILPDVINMLSWIRQILANWETGSSKDWSGKFLLKIFLCCLKQPDKKLINLIQFGDNNSRQTRGRFLKNCAQLLHRVPNFLTPFYNKEVERQKIFLGFDFFTRKSSQMLGARCNSWGQVFRNWTQNVLLFDNWVNFQTLW